MLSRAQLLLPEKRVRRISIFHIASLLILGLGTAFAQSNEPITDERQQRPAPGARRADQ